MVRSDFRLVTREGEDGRRYLQVHRAYYHTSGEEPFAIAVDPTSLVAEGMVSLVEMVEQLRAALDRPVLEYDEYAPDDAPEPPRAGDRQQR